MADTKTRPTGAPVDAFLAAVKNPVRRADGEALRAMMTRVTGEEAAMWGPSIIGFGDYHYRYDSGREGDMCRVGFAPRAANLVLYLLGFDGDEALLDRLGKHRRGQSCLYINKLADIDLSVLEEMIARAYRAAGTGRC